MVHADTHTQYKSKTSHTTSHYSVGDCTYTHTRTMEAAPEIGALVAFAVIAGSAFLVSDLAVVQQCKHTTTNCIQQSKVSPPTFASYHHRKPSHQFLLQQCGLSLAAQAWQSSLACGGAGTSEYIGVGGGCEHKPGEQCHLHALLLVVALALKSHHARAHKVQR